MALQEPLVGARQAIFGQDADHFKQRRADFVVKIFGGKFFLAGAAQSGAHLAGKIRPRMLSDHRGSHGVSSIPLRRVLVFDAAKLRVHVRVMRLEPVAERPPQHARGRARRTALHHEVLPIEEIRGIPGIERKWLEPGKGRKRRARPFPAIPHEIGDAEIAVALRVRSRREPDPSARNQNCRAARRALPRPRGTRVRRRCECRMRRDAIPLRSAILFPPSAHRPTLHRG